MCEFNVGDLVEARKGELVIRDRVVMKSYGLALGAMDWSLSGARLNGHTLSLVEAATPPLPTEEGAIITWNKGYAQETAVLEKTNQWLYNGNNFETAEIEQAIDGHPFTRLEPVQDIAKKVLDAVRERTFYRYSELGTKMHGRLSAEFDRVALDFGVES